MSIAQFQQQFDLLKNAHAQNRLSHAYLLSGIAGLGKTNFAIEFASFLLSDRPLNTHPDFILIQPEEKSRAIKIDQIRELSDKLSRTSHAGGYQVVIISPADSMPIAAANALLKTLEEPQGNVVIFLIDNQAHVLPKTVASRCQKIFFHPDFKALSLKNIDEKLQLQIFQHMQKIIVNRVNPIAPVSDWIKQDLAMVLKCIIVSAMMIARAYHEENSALKNIAEKIADKKLHQFLQLVCEKQKLVSQGLNLNAQLCLENIFIALSVR
ncbi:MAG: hypothetical protein Q8L78_05590 [Coxiellaceae bacterium]|nr:hypothetical protein [Coxiellaceae bacterium]